MLAYIPYMDPMAYGWFPEWIPLSVILGLFGINYME